MAAPRPPAGPASPAPSSQLLTDPRPVLAVGVDFGTHASGFAFAALGPDGTAPPGCRVHLHTAYPDQPAPEAKTRTALLYRGSTVEAWGWTAWRRWSELGAAERVAGRYAYIENFKLLLQGEGTGGGGGGVSGGGSGGALGTVCPLPRGVTAVTAAADYLKALRRYALEHLQSVARSGGPPAPPPDLVRWCLTVPAMWTEAAKARVREAAHRAGYTRVVDSPLLLTTLEPEAAALAAALDAAAPPAVPRPRAAAPAVPSPPAVSPGEVLLVVDCGGGTTDVTLHEVLRAAGGGAGAEAGAGAAAVRLAEAAVGQGALAGGCFVDEALWGLLSELVGEEAWRAWQEDDPALWTWLRNKWELAKRRFAGAPRAASAQPPSRATATAAASAGVPAHGLQLLLAPERNWVELPLPESLVAAMGAAKVQELSARYVADELAAASAPLPCLRPDGRTLLLPGPLLEARVFEPVVQRVLRLAEGVAEEGREGGRAATKVLLAGGFACSPLLQRRVRCGLLPALGLDPVRDLMLPQHPGAAVVQGAVLFGAHPGAVSARRSRLTYGVATMHPWCVRLASNYRRRGFPAKQWHDEEQRYYAKVFEPFVRRGQLVGADEVVTHQFSPYSLSQSAVGFQLYACDDADAQYLQEEGMRRLAAIRLGLPDGWADAPEVEQRGSCAYKVQADMRFGATELVLRAHDPATGKEAAASVRWAAQQ